MMRSISIVGWSYKNIIARMFRGSLWVPFLVVAATQALLLLVLVNFYQPALQWLGVPVMKLSGGEGSLHYPFNFMALPLAVARAEMAVGVLVASVASGAATLLFAKALDRGVGEAPWKSAFRRYPALLVYGLILGVLMFGTFYLQNLVPRDMVLESRGIRWGSRFGILGLAILIQSFLVYATAWMMLRGQSLGAALKSSVRFTGRNLVPTVILVAIPVLIKYPISWLQGRSDMFVSKFKPEALAAVLWADIAVEMVLTFLMIGTLTFFFLWKQEANQ